MTDSNHPITPPPELFKQWEGLPRSLAFEAAYRAGADQELEAMCKLLLEMDLAANGDIEVLRDARRPKPPSNKEQALSALSLIMFRHRGMFDGKPFDIIRKALEALPE